VVEAVGGSPSTPRFQAQTVFDGLDARAACDSAKAQRGHMNERWIGREAAASHLRTECAVARGSPWPEFGRAGADDGAQTP
jgi:hypothetical protein